MIIYIFSYKDSKQGCFTQPFYEARNPMDYKIIIERYLKQNNFNLSEKEKQLSELDLYCLGAFNDETGDFVNKKEFLLSFPKYKESEHDKNKK